MQNKYSECVKKIIASRIKQSGVGSFKPDREYFELIKNCKQQPKNIKTKKDKKENLKISFSFINKIKQYILAELYTIIDGQINKKEYAQRKSACLDCHGRVDSIEGKIDPGGIGFCSLCGCGASKRAALSVKLTIGGAACPLNKWSQLKGTEWSFKIAIQAIFGLIGSFQYYTFKKIKIIIGNIFKNKTT